MTCGDNAFIKLSLIFSFSVNLTCKCFRFFSDWFCFLFTITFAADCRFLQTLSCLIQILLHTLCNQHHLVGTGRDWTKQFLVCTWLHGNYSAGRQKQKCCRENFRIQKSGDCCQSREHFTHVQSAVERILVEKNTFQDRTSCVAWCVHSTFVHSSVCIEKLSSSRSYTIGQNYCQVDKITCRVEKLHLINRKNNMAQEPIWRQNRNKSVTHMYISFFK